MLRPFVLAILLAALPPAPLHPEGAARSGAVPPVAPVDSTFESAATIAWLQFDRLWVPGTGLARATPDYDKLTPWDMGSVLAALHSASILGILTPDEFRGRMTTTLATLERLPLYQGKVYHKIYHARTGRMVGKGGRESSRGYAVSATDLGRFLVWLKIIARAHPEFAAQAERIVRRMDFSRVVEDGYLYGEELSPQRRSGVRRFQEGRIGYEQYMARGFALWGADVALALDLNTNAAPLTVLGVELLADKRGLDRLTSEPIVLAGMELGWTPDEARLARNLLRVQEERFRATGHITIVSEDAINEPPHYFYYNCVYCSGRAFVIETAVPGRPLTGPRWISTKATFAWHALLPGDYTRAAMSRIAIARSSAGWSSGVLERSGRATRTHDINTAAVILTAAAYHRLGRPLLPREPLPTIAPGR